MSRSQAAPARLVRAPPRRVSLPGGVARSQRSPVSHSCASTPSRSIGNRQKPGRHHPTVAGPALSIVLIRRNSPEPQHACDQSFAPHAARLRLLLPWFLMVSFVERYLHIAEPVVRKNEHGTDRFHGGKPGLRPTRHDRACFVSRTCNRSDRAVVAPSVERASAPQARFTTVEKKRARLAHIAARSVPFRLRNRSATATAPARSRPLQP